MSNSKMQKTGAEAFIVAVGFVPLLILSVGRASKRLVILDVLAALL
jgi:hypothetical protein